MIDKYELKRILLTVTTTPTNRSHASYNDIPDRDVVLFFTASQGLWGLSLIYLYNYSIPVVSLKLGSGQLGLLIKFSFLCLDQGSVAVSQEPGRKHDQSSNGANL